MKLEHYQGEQPFSKQHLLTLMDYTPDEIRQCLALGLHLKAQLKVGIPHKHLMDKSIVLIFAKPSTRTRVSFEVGAVQLGCHPIFLSTHDIQLGRGETIHDTAYTLSAMTDCIMIRTYKQADVEGLALYGSIPVINGLTDLVHPCQVLADVMTLYEHRGETENQKIAFIGNGGDNVCHSLMIICSKLGIDFSAAFPLEYSPDPVITQFCRQYAAQSGAHIVLTQDPQQAVQNADAVYTDVWTSMGQENEFSRRRIMMQPYTVTSELFRQAKPDALFMHCLPARRGEEVVPSVIDGPQSIVFEQAENRLHVQKAIMCLLMSGKSYEELMR